MDENTDRTASAGRVALLFALGAFLLWLAPFALYGIAQSLEHAFRTADLPETVPPLLATLLVREVALFDVFRGAHDSVPSGVRVASTLGAPCPSPQWRCGSCGGCARGTESPCAERCFADP
ncbi:hypothetical protein ACIRD6_30595 [Streptomyces sp. NPDC102473]|uniref:hypothetical protein n=1 Tax=Streptomyces sp. NPDC102473 TaxID=3366180 RepID=UPI003816898E